MLGRRCSRQEVPCRKSLDQDVLLKHSRNGRHLARKKTQFSHLDRKFFSILIVRVFNLSHSMYFEYLRRNRIYIYIHLYLQYYSFKFPPVYPVGSFAIKVSCRQISTAAFAVADKLNQADAETCSAKKHQAAKIKKFQELKRFRHFNNFSARTLPLCIDLSVPFPIHCDLGTPSFRTRHHSPLSLATHEQQQLVWRQVSSKSAPMAMITAYWWMKKWIDFAELTHQV